MTATARIAAACAVAAAAVASFWAMAFASATGAVAGGVAMAALPACCALSALVSNRVTFALCAKGRRGALEVDGIYRRGDRRFSATASCAPGSVEFSGPGLPPEAYGRRSVSVDPDDPYRRVLDGATFTCPTRDSAAAVAALVTLPVPTGTDR